MQMPSKHINRPDGEGQDDEQHARGRAEDDSQGDEQHAEQGRGDDDRNAGDRHDADRHDHALHADDADRHDHHHVEHDRRDDELHGGDRQDGDGQGAGCDDQGVGGGEEFPATASPDTGHDLLHYEWDSGTGILSIVELKVTKGVTSSDVKRIMDFRPRLVAIAQLESGEAVWIVELTRLDPAPIVAPMRDTDRKNAQTAMAWLHNVAGAGHQFTVKPRFEAHLMPAMQMLGKNVTIMRVPETMGWHRDDSGAFSFVFPRGPAITAHGLDTNIAINEQYVGQVDALDARFERYGVGVAPISNEEERLRAWDAFQKLITCGDPAVTMLTVYGVVSALLRINGLATDPVMPVLVARTGSKKTSFLNTAMSMFGDFAEVNGRGHAVANWESSVGFAELVLATVRDLPVVFDDYKVGQDDEKVRRIIQMHADQTSGGKATRTGGIRASRALRGLIVATGEQNPAAEESTASRTFEIALAPDTFDNDRLREAQVAATDGSLQLFGGTLIEWPAGRSDIMVGAFVQTVRDAYRAQLIAALPSGAHLGIVAATSGMLAVGDVLLAFVHDVFPEHAALVRGWVDGARAAIFLRAASQAEFAATHSNARQFLDYFLAVTTGDKTCHTEHVDPDNVKPGEAYFWPDADPAPNLRSLCIAHHRDTPDDDIEFFFSEKVTFHHYRRREGDAVRCKWPDLLQDLVKNFGGVRARPRLAPRGASVPKRQLEQTSGVFVRLSAIAGVAGVAGANPTVGGVQPAAPVGPLPHDEVVELELDEGYS
jgi:hypothetical protein